jgi:membrane-associated phospholipid phosphatase
MQLRRAVAPGDCPKFPKLEISRTFITAVVWLFVAMLLSASALAQQATPPPNVDLAAITRENVSLKRLPQNLLTDQIVIWTSPARVKKSDTNWLVPIGLLTGSMIASDRWAPRTLDLSLNTQNRFSQLSDAGLAGFAAVAGGTYLLGKVHHNEYQRTAGLLAGESMIDAFAVGEVLKVSFGRERPGEGSMRNKFWQGGSGFPSAHALLAWSSAATLTEAYPGWGSKMLFYGGATAVSLSRVFANKHAPSDVLVGGTIGYLIGKKVYRRHTVDLELQKQYGKFEAPAASDEDRIRVPHNGSVYVPLDSWVYSAFDRLIALGAVETAIVGQRPWTRSECERLLETLPDDPTDDSMGAFGLVKALRSEFSDAESKTRQDLNAKVESLYVRGLGISGRPLTDSLDFGRTVVNDFGRPLNEGFNAVAGMSARAGYGSLAFYLRAEYQHAPDSPALSPSALAAVRNSIDPRLPLPPALAAATIDRVRLLDSYVTWNLANWQLSFGKQSLWWGPGTSGAMLISNNAEPITMARIDRIQPFTLPSILKLLGPIRMQMFVGRLAGHHFVNVENNFTGSYTEPLSDQPYMMGQKLSLKPTPNLEIGVSRTSVFGGPLFPLTPSRLGTVLFSTSTSNLTNNDPGDRRTSFDFSYRIPGLRNWLTLYADSMAEDEINPIAYPRRSAMNPGIYLAKIPKLNRMDFRAEAAYTDLPGLLLSDYFYWNLRYINGYTNKGDLIGNWVGREGIAVQFSSNYWFSQSNKLQLSYRRLSVSPDTGREGNQQDFKVGFDSALSSALRATGSVQYEKWEFPVLAPSPQSNVAISFQLSYQPKWGLKR